MNTELEISAEDFAQRTIIFPAVFAKAVNRFKQINVKQESVDLVNKAVAKKIEPSMSSMEDKVWAQWKNLTDESQLGEIIYE